MKKIIEGLKQQKTFFDFLKYIRDTKNLKMIQDTGKWCWLEYKGEIIKGTEKQRFISASEMDDLMKLAGLY